MKVFAQMDSDLQMNGAEAVIKALVENGVEVIFGYPGGAVLPLYDALLQIGTNLGTKLGP